MADPTTPLNLAYGAGHALDLTWADGHRSSYPPRYLRGACRCAGCVHELTGEALLDPTTIPEDVKPAHVVPVGRYGLQVAWTDGHRSGIYAFSYLRELCPCCHGAVRDR